MNKTLKKLLFSFFLTGVFYVGIYFLIKTYDFGGNTLEQIHQNIYYLIFLFVSIVAGITLYENENNKSKFIISIIFIINFIYLIFLFSLSNMGLSSTQGYFLIAFLLLGIISINIKNWFGILVISLSTLGVLGTIFSVLIPLYPEGPDIEGFSKQFQTQFIIYSNVSLNKDNASVEKDKKVYYINNGISSSNFKLGLSGSEIIFKSNNLYQNSFAYILFDNKEILQIYPQSAIKINENFEIEIIAGMVKYYPANPINFKFTGEILSSIMANQENIDTIYNWHDQEFKQYIIKQLGGNKYKNKTILRISKKTLEIFNYLFPAQFGENLENFKLFDKYLDYDLDIKIDKEIFDQNKIQQGFFESIKNGFNKTKLIK